MNTVNLTVILFINYTFLIFITIRYNKIIQKVNSIIIVGTIPTILNRYITYTIR